MVKNNFLGGIQTQASSEKSDFENTYQLLVNGRVRNNVVEPVKSPVDIEVPEGLLQCLASFDDNILCFVGGIAYYRKTSQAFWTQISGAQLSATAPRVYLELLPGSSVNFKRKSAYGVIDESSPTGSSRSCLFCTDGETQPMVIFPDGSSRTTKTWAEWTATDREYVPICICPRMIGAKLYVFIKDSDGRFTQIAHSVTGRPLDFVLLVNDAGDKAGPGENEFGAPALRFHVGYEPLTAISPVPGADGAFIVSSIKRSTQVIPDFDNLIAGEPTFRRQPLFDVGAFGPESITDVNGDTAVVYPGGIRTYNAVMQLKWQGKNSPLNRQIQNLTTAALQTTGATCQFDNYTGFAVQTKFGPGIVWWDQTLGVFVALDIWPGVAKVVEFAPVITSSESRLFFRTEDGKVFEAFAGSYGENQITLQDLSPVDGGSVMALRSFSAAFLLGTTQGYASVDVYADRDLVHTNTEVLPVTSAQEDPSARPITPGTLVPDSTVAEFKIPQPVRAYKSTVVVRWSGDARLSSLEINEEVTKGTSNLAVPSVQTVVPVHKLVFFSDDGLINAARTNNYSRMRREDNVTAFIGAGDHAYDSGTDNEVAARFSAYWGIEKLSGKFYAAPGNHDLDTDNGRPFFQFVRQTPERYSKTLFGTHTEVFLFNSGLNTAGTQTDPLNSDGASLLDSTQAKTLLRDLAASTARNKIVVWHHPPYTSSATYYPGITTFRPLTEAIANAGASALVCGHAHLYERLNKYLPIFIVGTGGAALHSLSTTLAEGSKKQIIDYGYLRVNAGPLRCIWEFVGSSGTVLDKFIT